MTNVDIGKLYGVCRKFITVWDDPYAEPAAFGPAVTEMRELLTPQQDDDTVERVAAAIHAADDDDGYIDTDMVPHLENDYPRYESMAKAALHALGEVSDD